jgi:hypothetical protein
MLDIGRLGLLLHFCEDDMWSQYGSPQADISLSVFQTSS